MNKVHGVEISPFVRKVLLTLEYKGVDYEHITVIPGSGGPDFLKKSPLGKIPLFEDEYITVPDSSIICQYLDEKYPNPTIYPSSPASRARARWFEEFSDSKLIELLGGGLFFELLVAPRLMGRPTDWKKVAETKRVLPRYLGYLEKEVRPNDFLVDNTFSIADMSVAAMFVNARYAGYEVDKTLWPRLAAYLALVWDFPVFRQRLEKEKPMADSMTGK